MRLVLLFSLFVIWCAGPPGWQLFRDDLGIPIFFTGYLAILAVVAVVGRWWVRRLDGSGPVARPAGYFWLLESARYAIVVWFAAGVFMLGWRPAVDRLVGTSLRTPGTVIGLAPGLLAWAGLWWAAFPVERAVRELNVVYDVEAGLPVFAFPSLAQYLGNKCRGQLLFLVVPVVMMLAARDVVAAVWIRLLGHSPFTDDAESVVTMTAVVLVMLIAPAVLRHVLQTMPLPDSPLRDRLSSVSRSVGVGVRDILLWNTHHNTGNAAVMGLVRPVRYVMLSDLLVETMSDLQIQAVFAHELGHVRHRHLFWLGAFFVGVGGAIFSAVDRVHELVNGSAAVQDSVELVSAAIGMAVLLGAFGFVSRWFERQADVFAARSVGTGGVPNVEIGAHAFAGALHRIAVVNNTAPTARDWTHGSIQARTRYVMKLATDPEEAARFDRRGRWITAGLATAITIGLAAAVVLSF